MLGSRIKPRSFLVSLLKRRQSLQSEYSLWIVTRPVQVSAPQGRPQVRSVAGRQLGIMTPALLAARQSPPRNEARQGANRSKRGRRQMLYQPSRLGRQPYSAVSRPHATWKYSG